MATSDAERTERGLRDEIETLQKALAAYTECRHASVNCRCTSEARAVLYPYKMAELKRLKSEPQSNANSQR